MESEVPWCSQCSQRGAQLCIIKSPRVRLAGIMALADRLTRTEVVDFLNRVRRHGSGLEKQAAATVLGDQNHAELRLFSHLGKNDPATDRYTPPNFD